MAETEKVETPVQEQGGSEKISKAYDTSLGKVLVLLKGPDLFKKAKTPFKDIQSIADELFKERRDATRSTIKSKILKLTENKVELDKVIKKLQEEVQKQIDNKKKEFTEACNDLLREVEDGVELEKAYLSSLKDIEEATKEAKSPVIKVVKK